MKLLIAAVFASVASAAADSSSCKCFPGDSCWPTTSDWNRLNSTVGGRLIATVPLATPCHGASFNDATCDYLQSQWQSPGIHMNNSASVMAPFFANQSCDPFTDKSVPCTLGNYVRYAVDVKQPSDVVAAVQFAAQKNIRFVIRNTGHDYLGRSTGAGALSVWTHHLKNITFQNWNDANYKGPSVTIGAGVQGFEIMEAAKNHGLAVVGGECPTVGVAGGYTQGGGHSALSTNFGLAADNTLQFTVVTAAGKLLTASRTQNSDLYWALSGGGGGNYAVVLSATYKAFRDSYVGGATLAFLSSDNPTETFYKAIDAFHAALPAMVDSGTMVVYYFGSTFFQIAPLNGFNKTEAEVKAIMAPYLATLDSMKVVYTVGYSQFSSYYDHYDKYFGPFPVGNIQVGIAQYGGRLIPRSVITNNNSGLGKVARSIVEQGVTWIGVGTNVAPFGKNSANSVLPAWRSALVHATLTTPWSFDPSQWNKMLANQDLMTKNIMPAIEAVTPGSGAYMNEANFQQPNFQSNFFGCNYNSLLKIKQKYDPNGLFWATKAVGSESWTVAANGRMCMGGK